MKQRKRTALTALMLSSVMASGTASFATESEAVDIEQILSQLNQQQDHASPLVKSVREPLSLLSSSVISSKATNSSPLTDSDSSKATNKSTHKPNKKDDILDQLTAVASTAINKFKQTGLASWYGRQFHGKPTASGEKFDMNALTAAHPSLPLNCYIKVTNKDNGKSVVVRVNDRGPFHGKRVLDLSYGAAKAIGITQRGSGNVAIERVDGPQSQ